MPDYGFGRDNIEVRQLSTADVISFPLQGLKIAYGQHTTVAASDTIITGLANVVAVIASYDTDPADANLYVSASIGDQAGSPAAGSVLIKTWKSADGADPTPAAASAFSKKVNWIAFGS